ncbi:MAG: enoyl-CoA hydratase-related protein [Acidimicrobiia bacterium]
MSPLVIRADDGPVRTLTLNRPEKLNALSSELTGALSEELTLAADDETVHVIVLGGAGRSFCAGYDLGEESPAGGYDEALAGLDHLLDRLLQVFDQPQPVVAMVQGHCLAGGCDLMMMCDLVVASDDSVFGQPEIKFGSAIVAHVLPWLVGARRAKELVLTGHDRVDADTAAAIGLVNRVVPRADLETEAMALAHRLAVVDPAVSRATKRAVNAGWEQAGFRQALRRGVEIGAEIEAIGSPERLEFERIVAEQGLRAAIRWRDERFHR